MSTQNTISFEIEVIGKSETIKKITEIEVSLREVGKERRKLTKSYEEGAISEAKYKEELSQLVAKQKVLRSEKTQLNRQLKNEQKQLQVNEGSMAALRLETNKLAKTVNDFAVGVDGSEKELKQLKKQLAANRKAIINWDQSLNSGKTNVGRYRQSLGSLTSTFQKFGGALGIGIGLYGVSQAMSISVQTFADFEQKMKDVQAVSGASGEDLERLRQNAKQLGETTQFTASQVADLQLAFARIGFDSTKIEAATASTLNLAVATGEDLAGAAEVVANTLGGYQLSAAETTRITDVMAASFNSSALNLERFKESTKLVAPVANAANVSIETTTAALGALANSGISGTEAGTALRRIISELSNENSKVSKTLGFSVKSSDDLVRAFKELNKAGIDNTKAIELVGRNAQSAFTVLANSSDTLEKLSGDFMNASGSAKVMAGIVGDSLSQDFKKLQSAVEGLQINFVELSSGGLPTAVQMFTSFIDMINDFIAIPMSKKLQDDQDELNILASALISTADEQGNFNEENNLTKDLITELNAKYPKFFENLNQEELSVSKIRDRLKELNNEYVTKIQLQSREEELQKIANKQAINREKRRELAKKKAEIEKGESKTITSFSKGGNVTIGDQKEKDLAIVNTDISVAEYQAKQLNEQAIATLKEKNELLKEYQGLFDAIKKQDGSNSNGDGDGDNKDENNNNSNNSTLSGGDDDKKAREAAAERKRKKAEREREAKQKKSDEERLQAELLQLQNQGILDEIALIEDGLERETKLKIAQSEQEIKDLEARKIVKENLTKDEIAFNEAIDKTISIRRKELNVELNAIDKKYRDDGTEEAKDSLKDKIKAIEDTADKERQILEGTVSDTVTLEKAKRDLAVETARKKLELLEAEALASGTITQAQLDQIKAVKAEIANLTKPDKEGITRESFMKDLFGLEEEEAQIAIDTAQKLSSDIYSFLQEQRDLQIEKELNDTIALSESRKEVRLKALEREKEQGLVTEAEYQQRKETIEYQAEKQRERAEERAFEQEKAVQRKRVITESAVGAIRAVATSIGNPFAIALKLAALAVQTGLSIASINSQEFPRGEKGMFLSKGKRHAQGGEIVELEQGEAVLNRRILESKDVFSLTGTPLQIADALNSHKGMGIAFLKENRLLPTKRQPFEFGGQLPVNRVAKVPSYNTNNGISKEEFAVFADKLIARIEGQKLVASVRDISREQAKLRHTKQASIWNK